MTASLPVTVARRARPIAFGISACALTAAMAADAATDRVIIALDPPAVESNLSWDGIGERLPSLQALVGHDPITGVYDTSELAREWYANDDFTEWTFHLHEDAEWHFGWGPVTAHDVVHSYELHVAPDSTAVGLAVLRAQEVEAIDDHTVVFRFDDARTDYAFNHAGRGSMAIYSKAQYDAEGIDGYNTKPAGTAPYQFVERRAGEGLLFERAPDQWQGIEPEFAELQFRWAAEPSTKLAMLIAGEAHIADLPRELQPDALDAGMAIVSSQNSAMHTGVQFNGLYMRDGDPAFNPDVPWTDVRVREAMNRAVDREVMIEILYDGRAEIVPSWIMHPPHEGWVQELADNFERDYGYDPERAKELLAEAGYPDAFAEPVIPIVSTTLAGNPEFGTMAELLQVFFEEAGFQTEMRELDWALLYDMARNRANYHIHPIRNAPIRPSETGLVNYFTTRGSPIGGYESDTLEAMIDELEGTIDPDHRDRIAADIFVYLYEQYADLPLAAVHAEMTVNPEVVADWTFPGVTTNSLSHYHLIERAD